jgi:hypothetical protein
MRCACFIIATSLDIINIITRLCIMTTVPKPCTQVWCLLVLPNRSGATIVTATPAAPHHINGQHFGMLHSMTTGAVHLSSAISEYL